MATTPKAKINLESSLFPVETSDRGHEDRA